MIHIYTFNVWNRHFEYTHFCCPPKKRKQIQIDFVRWLASNLKYIYCLFLHMKSVLYWNPITHCIRDEIQCDSSWASHIQIIFKLNSLLFFFFSSSYFISYNVYRILFHIVPNELYDRYLNQGTQLLSCSSSNE